jgi:hypothetical protein
MRGVFASREERDAVVASKIGSVVRGKIDISHHISCWATVERTASYGCGDRSFVAGYGANSDAGHGAPPSMGRVGFPSSALLLLSFPFVQTSPVSPPWNPSRRLFFSRSQLQRRRPPLPRPRVRAPRPQHRPGVAERCESFSSTPTTTLSVAAQIRPDPRR